MNSRIISGMLLCCEEKANQMQDEKSASCNGNSLCDLRFLMSYLIGDRTIEMSKSRVLDLHCKLASYVMPLYYIIG